MTPRSRAGGAALLVVLALSRAAALLAAEHAGQVTVGGVAVPGATVTASRGEQRVVTSTDTDGIYRFPDLGDGTWTIAVGMVGFSSSTREVTVGAGAQPAAWELTLLPYEEIARSLPPPAAPAAASRPAAASGNLATTAPAAAPAAQGTFQRAGVSTAPAPPAAAQPARPAEDPPADPTGIGAADGLLINGSVNNGAASPFAQLAAFGNNRRGQRSLYNGGLGVLLGSSALDARPYSFTSVRAPKPDYSDVQFLGTFGGPLRIPGLIQNAGVFTLGYQRSVDNTTITEPALLPTALERRGDFSQTTDALGRPVRVVDPRTGLPFPGHAIPLDRISPQAAALLGYYPDANIDGSGYNFQRPVVTATQQDNLQSRLQRQLTQRDGFLATFAFQRSTAESTSLLGFDNRRDASGIDASGTFTHRFSQFITTRFRYQYTRQTNETLPYFANRINVSGDAGIAGNNQDPVNWGPPALVLLERHRRARRTRLPALPADADACLVGDDAFYNRGRHAFTLRRRACGSTPSTSASQQDPRGSFTFTGTLTGVDVADFLLGMPSASAHRLRQRRQVLPRPAPTTPTSPTTGASAPSLTVQAGVRWEYEAPITETLGRLVNLDVAPGLRRRRARCWPATRSAPLTGETYPESLVRPDKRGIQPRLGIAWRPVARLVAGGARRLRHLPQHTVYQSMATRAGAAAAALAHVQHRQNSPAKPLTLANGFTPRRRHDTEHLRHRSGFRVGYAHNWQASLQRDLPASLTVVATYLGTQRQSSDAAVPAQHLCRRARQPVPVVSDRLRLPHIERQLDPARRAAAAAPAAAQRPAPRPSNTPWPRRDDDAAAFIGASLTGRRSRRTGWTSTPSAGRRTSISGTRSTAQVQYTTRRRASAAAALMDGFAGPCSRNWTITSQVDGGQRPAADADLPVAGGRHRHQRHRAREPDRRRRSTTSRRLLRQPGRLRAAGAGDLGRRRAQLDARARAVHA